MNLSRDELRRLEAATGFRAATLEKVIRLGAVAREIAVHPFLGPRLVLKGGTAIQLALGVPKRLSVDLDYNYIGQLERTAMLVERPEVEADLLRVARAGRYQVSQSADEHAARKFHLGYRSHAGSPDRIELDINFQMRLPIDEPIERELWQPAQAPQVMIRTVGDEELWAGKIAALLDRTMARDVFDVAHLNERSPGLARSTRFRRVFIAWSGSLPHPLHRYGQQRIERLDDESLEQQLVPMLSSATRPSREDLVRRSWEVLEPILDLDGPEREYCDRIQRGELMPELLFGDDAALAERFRQHPALQWKAASALAHHSRNRSDE